MAIAPLLGCTAETDDGTGRSSSAETSDCASRCSWVEESRRGDCVSNCGSCSYCCDPDGARYGMTCGDMYPPTDPSETSMEGDPGSSTGGTPGTPDGTDEGTGTGEGEGTGTGEGEGTGEGTGEGEGEGYPDDGYYDDGSGDDGYYGDDGSGDDGGGDY